MKKTPQKGFSQILASVRNDGRRRLISKIPQWGEWADIIKIPAAINLEQCTCGAAASYKAEIARKLIKTAEGAKIADLTGGLGVDSRAFSKIAAEVLHNERNKELSQTVAANFAAMGTDNVRFSNFDVSVENKSEWEAFLRDFSPDMIYVDPARRDSVGHKIFLPSDCSPDIVSLLPSLLEISGIVMVKFSPLMDIRALLITFEGSLAELHVVSSGAEVKEILCLFKRSSRSEPEIFISENNCESGPALGIGMESENNSAAIFLSESNDVKRFPCLFEPGAGLMKAGLFKYVSARYGFVKLAPSTHLYLCDGETSGLGHFGKFFRILETLPFDKSSIKKIAKEYPHADITARNIPLSSEELRARAGMTSGPNPQSVHIFGAGICTASESGKMLFVTSPLQ